MSQRESLRTNDKEGKKEKKKNTRDEHKREHNVIINKGSNLDICP